MTTNNKANSTGDKEPVGNRADEYQISQHFVTFLYPSVPHAETVTRAISEWDTTAAVQMAKDIRPKPYAFRFSTKARTAEELDSREVANSGLYFMGGIVETIDDMRNNPEGRTILLRNMETNGYARVITTLGKPTWCQPLGDDDVVLDMSSI